MLRRLLRFPLAWLAIAVLLAGSTFGLYWFQPWKLFSDTTVVSAGDFVTHEHDTSGSARIVRTPDGWCKRFSVSFGAAPLRATS